MSIILDSSFQKSSMLSFEDDDEEEEDEDSDIFGESDKDDDDHDPKVLCTFC